MIDCELKDRT